MIFRGIDICCPFCRGELREVKSLDLNFFCVVCDRYFPIVFDIPDLRVFPDPYIDLEADRAKGLELAARFLLDWSIFTTALQPLYHQNTHGNTHRGSWLVWHELKLPSSLGAKYLARRETPLT
jgi:uncharacterized protein YbaR (Trm112 family)